MKRKAKKILSFTMAVMLVISGIVAGGPLNSVVNAEAVSDTVTSTRTEIYNMQSELSGKGNGDMIEGTYVLEKSGNPIIKVEDNEEAKKLVLTNRTNDYDAIDIKPQVLNLNSDCNYEFTVTGKILAGDDNYVKMLTVGGYSTLADSSSDASFELSKTFSGSDLQELITDGKVIRIQQGAYQDGTISDFEIYSIIITEINVSGGSETPTTETVTMKVGGANNPWPEYAVDAHELTIGGEPVAFTLTSKLENLSKISTAGGDLRIHTDDPAKNDYIIDDLLITVNGITKYSMQTDSKIVVGNTFSSDTLGISGDIKTAVVDNESKKSISVTERAAQWAGIIIKFDELTKMIGESGTNIVITITGRVVPSPIPDAIPADAEKWMEVPSLKDTYKDYFLIGNIISSGAGPGRTDNVETTEGYKYHYDVVTAENEMKPDYYGNTGLDVYDFTKSDKIVEWAKANDILVQGHTLAWHSQSPEWLNKGLTRAQAKANLENFIENVAGYYENKLDKTNLKAGGNVFAWDVVNEAHLERSTNWKANLRTGNDGSNLSYWYEAYANGADTAAGESGADYIYDAFKFARKYAPSATLYYNDFNDDNATKSTAIANMVKDINEQWKKDGDYDGRNLIEGIGMQSHYSTNVSVKNVEASIQRFIDAGAMVSITELDVGTDDKTKAGYIKQAQVYAQLFQVYKKHSDNIERVTFWGITDDLSWRANNNPLIFDKNFMAKEAYYAVIDPEGYLKKHPMDAVVAKPKTSIAVYGTPSMESGVIDSAWDTAVSLNADRFVEGTKAYPNFATGEFKVMWDEDNLYVLGVVTDEKVAATATAAYLQDCVEVFFSPSNNKTGPKVTYDGQHRVNCNNVTSEDSRDGFESVLWTTETGYVVKMKLPFNDPDVTPKVDMEIGFDCQVNDEGRESTGTRNSVAVWCDTSNGSAYSDTSAWGTLILVKDVNAKVLIKDTAVGKAASGKPSGGDVEARMNSTDWTNVGKLPIFKWTTNGGSSIFGTSRATGTAQAKWDETYLYVRVEVKDSDLNTKNKDNWLKDCVEVYINDTGSAGGQSRLTYNGLKDGPVANGGNTFVKDTGDGYIAYLEIPHGLTAPETGDIIKFDVQISDATTTANDRTGITTWSDWTANGYNSSENFGKLILVENSGEKPAEKPTEVPGGGNPASPAETPKETPVNNVMEKIEKQTENGETVAVVDKKGEYDFSETKVTEKIKVVADEVVIKNITSEHDVVLEGKNITLENASLEKDLQISGRNATLTNSVVKGDVALSGALSEVKNTTVNGTFSISGNKSVVENVTIKNDFIIGKELKNGEIRVSGTKISGKVTINGGGKNSVYFTDTTANTVVVNKKAEAGNQTVRLVLDGKTTVKSLTLQSKATIASNGNKGSIKNLTVGKNADKSTVLLTKADSVTKYTLTKGAAIKVKAANGTLSLKSSNKNVAAVSKAGTMKAYKKGNAKVNITLNNKKAITANVVVK